MVTNAITVLAVARYTEGDTFGRFALLYGLGQFSIGVYRSAMTDVAAARFGGQVEVLATVWRDVRRRALVYGVAMAVLVSGIGVAVGVDGPLAVALALGLAIALHHETLRGQSFALLAPFVAVVADVAWLVVNGVGLGLLVLFSDGSPNVVHVVLVWGLGAAVGRVVAARRLGAELTGSDVDLASVSDPSQSWSEERRRSSMSFAFEFVVARGIPEAVAIALAAAASFEATGAYRLAIVIMGPIGIIVGGTRSIFAAELSQLGSDRQRGFSLATRAGLVLAAIPLVYAVALVSAPVDLGRALAGPGALTITPYVIYLGVRRSATTVALPAFLFLRVVGASLETVKVRTIEASATALALVALVRLGDERSILVCLPIIAWVFGAVWWFSAYRLSRAEGPSPAGADGQ